jgi:hypothetical protein
MLLATNSVEGGVIGSVTRSLPGRSYCLFGLCLNSQVELPYRSGRWQENADVTIERGEPLFFRQFSKGLALHRETDGWYLRGTTTSGDDYLTWPELFEFVVSADGRTIRCGLLGRGNAESLRAYLMGAVLSYALVKQGYEPLHATTVVINGVAFGLLGESGQGKTTLAASLLSAGHQILSDDMLLVRVSGRGAYAFPGPPRLKAFPEIVERFLPASPGAVPMNPGARKLILPLSSGQHIDRSVRMSRLYVLESGEAAGTVRIDPLAPAASTIEIVKASFNPRISHRSRLRRQFALAAQLAQSIQVKKLGYARSFDALPLVHRAIIDDLTGGRTS